MEENEERTGSVVLDTNVIISSLIRTEGVTRIAFLFLVNKPSIRILCPESAIKEIRKYEGEIARRTGITARMLMIALDELLKNIEVREESSFKTCITKVKDLVKDEKDIPFAALALDCAPSFLVTYNKKDYQTTKLKERGVIVAEPVEALREMGIDLKNIKISRRKRGGLFSVIAKILALIKSND